MLRPGHATGDAWGARPASAAVRRARISRRYAESMAAVSPPDASFRPVARAGRAVRWGVPDALWVWVSGMVGAVVCASVAYALRGPVDAESDVVVFAASVIGQYAALIGFLLLVSRRKGIGSLARDFGLRLHLLGDWWVVPVGFGVQIAANLALIPISALAEKQKAAQDVVQRLESSTGAELLLIVLSAAVVAPVVEEVLFRGLLLRALLRRMPATPAVGLSAMVFASAHLLDPGALLVLPGLLLVGLVNGVLAVRRGDLSRPILLHVGFNLLVVVVALGSG